MGDDKHVEARLRDSDEPFEVAENRFADLEPGSYTFFLAMNAKTLEFTDFVVPVGEAPVAALKGAQTAQFFSGTKQAGDPGAVGLFGQLFTCHLMLSHRMEDFEARIARIPEIEEIEKEVAHLSQSLYSQIATLLVDEPANVREEISRTLVETGLRGFLPKKLSQIERAAKVSLLSNAASRPEEFATYMSMNLNEGLDFDLDALVADMSAIFEADPHQLIFRRKGDVVTWAI